MSVVILVCLKMVKQKFGTSLLCENHSEVFEGIAHFVKISITIKANGFHSF